jgi:hypothetical protein
MNNAIGVLIALILAAAAAGAELPTLERLSYNHPGLVVDLGVGLWAWPLPMDFDGDGDLDLVVSCPDKPYNGTYLFENATGPVKFPVFKPGQRISRGSSNVSPSYLTDRVAVLTPGYEHADFRRTGLEPSVQLPLPANLHPNRVRHNQWKYVDYDGDGRLDLVVGVEDWTDYGWDDAYNPQGVWTNGPLHGLVYLLRNVSDAASSKNDQPKYAPPVKIEAGGQPVDTFGLPSPNFADFDADGDLDLLCGEFLDGFTYFENLGSRTAPRYASGRRLMHEGQPLTMDLQMIVPVALDWDADGDQDLVVGDEDGRVALVENTGRLADRLPQFLPPRYFQQEAADVKFGALATPVGFDWDGDGDEDLLCGNTAGYIGFFENLSGPGVEQPRWAAARLLEAGGRVIRIQAGSNGSIQGPCEAKWGYTTLSAADWDHDGLPDLIINSIWGRIEWFRNIGTRRQPKLAAAQPVEVQWHGPPPKPAWNWWDPLGQELVTQWRTTPVVVDWNADGLNDLLVLDHEGYLALFERRRANGRLELLPGRRILADEQGRPLQLNPGRAGKSGRRKLCVADWDGDGRLDLLVNSQNANWLRQVATRDGLYLFRDMGPLSERPISGHTTSPTVVDWNHDRIPDLLVGAEDGRLYYARNPRPSQQTPGAARTPDR